MTANSISLRPPLWGIRGCPACAMLTWMSPEILIFVMLKGNDMTKAELDDWFFNLPVGWQMEITAIYINEDVATDADYDKFDRAVEEWWDDLDYEDQLAIYKNEEPSA